MPALQPTSTRARWAGNLTEEGGAQERLGTCQSQRQSCGQARPGPGPLVAPPLGSAVSRDTPAPMWPHPQSPTMAEPWLSLTEGHRKGPGGGPPGRTCPAAATGGGPRPPAAGPRAGTAAAAAHPLSRSARGPASAARPCPAGCGRAVRAAPPASRWPVGQRRAGQGRRGPSPCPPATPRSFISPPGSLTSQHSPPYF